MMQTFELIVTQLNDVLWNYILIVLLIGCALWFTYKTKFVQFTMVREMVKLLSDSGSKVENEKHHISSFQAFCISLASRVGTGNLAGVASAITVGGPGAIFWMWIIALIGAASAFVESTLAQLYKRKGKGSFVGGPAYYMFYGLKKRWMAVLFAILITLTFGFAFNSVQSNTMSAALEHAFGWNHIYVGIVTTIIMLIVVFGGITRIAKVSSFIVPIMAIGYILLALFVIILNFKEIPAVLSMIVNSAFGWEQFFGGGVGIALSQGIKRGLFSNEAGMGSAPNAAATASVSHPVKQGLIQTLGVFTDTLIICTCTALIILFSGIIPTPDINGVRLTQMALSSEIGSIGTYYVAISLLFFAFSSIIGNYYYGEANIMFITQKRWVLSLYRVASGGMVLFGALATLNLVWNLADFFMALMTMCNLAAIILLGKYAFKLLDDYRSQKRAKIKSPVFRKEIVPEIADDLECWE